MGPDAEEAARSLGSVRLGPASRRRSLTGPTGCPFIPGRVRRLCSFWGCGSLKNIAVIAKALDMSVGELMGQIE